MSPPQFPELLRVMDDPHKPIIAEFHGTVLGGDQQSPRDRQGLSELRHAAIGRDIPTDDVIHRAGIGLAAAAPANST